MQPMINVLLDPVVNFGKVTVNGLYLSTATSVPLLTGHGTRLPDPSPLVDGPFNLVWYNSSKYADPADDPNVEIVRCTLRAIDSLAIIERGQENTSASDKNSVGDTYKMILAPTKKMFTDIPVDTQSKVNTHSALSTGVHGVGIDIIDGVSTRNIAISTHSSATSSVHGFDASGNAPAKTHDILRHTGTIGDHTVNISNIGSNTHAQIDIAITASMNHIASNGTSVHSLGTMSTQTANNVTITGGSVTGITDLAITDGGTGRSDALAYTPICGGTTSTNPHQSVASAGTAGQVLTSNGAGALPTFQSVASTGFKVDGFFGTGIDGTVTISVNTTITKDMFYTSLTVNNGITLNTGGFRIFVKGTLTNNGTISRAGIDATDATAGTGLASGSLGASGAGGSSNHGAGGSGGGVMLLAAKTIINNGTITVRGGHGYSAINYSSNVTGGNGASMTNSMGGAGGIGGGTTSGAGGGSGGTVTVTNSTLNDLASALTGRNYLGIVNGGAGGGGGGTTNFGGGGGGSGGGGGGGVILLVYNSITLGTIDVSGGLRGASAWGTGLLGSNGTAGIYILFDV